MNSWKQGGYGMNVNNIWQQIDSILNDMDFRELWKGFKRYKFVLYDDERVYFGDRDIEVDNRFKGNTSIDYEGEKIAIWRITEKDLDSIEILTSNIVHEMFHAFQLDNEENRFPNDIKGLDKPLEVEHYNIKKKEARLLIEAITSKNDEIKLSNLVEIISIRDKRSRLYRGATEYEFKIETLEGTAEYVGTMALKTIDEKKYKERIGNYLQIIADNNMIFNTRRYSYFYGTLLLILLDSMNIQLSQEIKDNPNTIMEELMSIIGERVEIERIPIDPAIEENMIKCKEELFNRFNKFHATDRKNHFGKYSITGYDPMNMYKLEKEILHEHFVCLYDHDGNRSIFIEGPVITVYNEDGSQIINYIV